MIRPKPSLLLLALTCCSLVGLTSQAAQNDESRILISLDGQDWKLAGLNFGEGEKLGIQAGAPANVVIRASVPSDVQLAMGLKDPYGQQPEIVAINKREWWYVRSFPSPRVGLDQQVRLVFDGVDYFADVWLNGQRLGSHEGAFTRFSFDVTKLLRVQVRSPRQPSRGDNYLAVRVTSPWKVPGRSHYEFMKGEFEENWDALPGPGQVVFPLGLHRSVRLEVTNSARIDELQVSTSALKDQQADLRLRLAISNAGSPRQGTLRLTIRPENFTGHALDLPPQHVSLWSPVNGPQEINLNTQVPNAQLWWTWDQGPQNLYRAVADLVDGTGRVLDSTSTVFGIRTLERDDNTLYRLNGRPVFLRGAWYPFPHMYPADRDRWSYEKDLRLAKNANMNHLVNYTVVETEDFYDLADRLGILIFVELPFNQEGPIDAVNAHYPRRDEYIQWASQEVAQIVRSLANHPSVGIWSAVSEVTNNGVDFTTASDPRIVEAADGYALFVKKMGEVVQANDPDALYFRSYCDFGEHHFWEGSLFQGTTYDQQFDAKAQFVSEYGALAFYPFESIRRIVDPDQIWNSNEKPWSDLALPVNLKKLSYLTGFQYMGLGFLTSDINQNVNRHLQSFYDYVEDSQVYQAFLYGYAADAYRRKLFNPINGIRSWMFKSFPEKPVAGFGVIDCFDAPTMAYYAQKRTYAPVTMSFAARYALESVPAGTPWNVPVWISNATNDNLALSVESTLYSLKGETVFDFGTEVLVAARQAQYVYALKQTVPEVPGMYLLRGRARRGSESLATAEMYVKVAPRATRKVLQVLVVGTRDWAQPVADYLTNLGAVVTAVIHEPTVIREPELLFPGSPASLRENYDVIWLAGFNNYWREAPLEWTETIKKAVEAGVTFVHTGSWASFHGGGEKAAALDLTALAELLPVEVGHENDLFVKNTFQASHEANQPPASSSLPRVTVSTDAPQWLKDADLAGLAPDSYHLLKARADATVLLGMDGQPLLVSGRYRKGRTLAYLGFSPEASGPVVVDRAIRSTQENRLFTIISASLLALASGEAPPAPLKDLLETRVTPLCETLKGMPQGSWPSVSASWSRSRDNQLEAQIHIKNGSTYLRGLRLRFDGPDLRSGRALALWSDQYFDFLPGEEARCEVEMIAADHKPLQGISLKAETISRVDSHEYKIPPPPQ